MVKKKPFNPLSAELRKLGLNKKEAEIYLLLLEKRTDTVLSLSQKTSLSRPTVYRILDSLVKKDLVFNDKEKKKSLYTANSPESFLNALRIQRRKVEEQEREFLRIISALQNKYYATSKKNEIKTYSLKTVFEDFSNTTEKDIRILCLDKEGIVCKKISRAYPAIRKRLGKISIREISCCASCRPENDFLKRKNIQPPATNKSTGLIVTDKIFILNKKQALCIEEESTVDFMKIFFDLLWLTKN